MNAEAKSERLGGLRAVKVKGCGFGKDGVVATGGGEPEGEPFGYSNRPSITHLASGPSVYPRFFLTTQKNR